MMSISDTALSVVSVKRIHGRAILTLSNGETLNMPRALLRERPYKAGMTFDPEAFDRLMNERAYSFALEKAVSLLAMRAHTEKEILDALRKNAYSEASIAKAMAHLHEAGYIDDADFAAQWVNARTSRGLGTRRIRMELHHKGVSSAEIDRAIDDISEDELISGALKAAKRAARGKDLTSPTDRQKILAALARRGYDFSIAKQVLSVLRDSE